MNGYDVFFLPVSLSVLSVSVPIESLAITIAISFGLCRNQLLDL
jgi:hypothetical protein